MKKPQHNKLKLLVLASTYPRWKKDTLPPFVHELARRLTNTFDVHVLAPHAPGAAVHEILDGVQIHRFRYLPESLETIAYSGGMLPGLFSRPWRLLGVPIFLLAQWISAIRLLRRYRFGVVHAHWLLPQGLIAVLAVKVSGVHAGILCTGHGADVFALNGKLVRHLKGYALKNSARVTVVSNAMLDALRSITVIDQRYSVLPMGVDAVNRFVPGSTPPNPRSILFVGRLAEKKGVRFLLEALALIEDRAGIKLRIIGSGTEEAHLRMLTEQLHLNEQVKFEGPVPNQALPDWYQNSAITVFPSIATPYGDQEGFGLVPAEALACGCAVIASDLPAVRDVIRDKETGLLVPPKSSKALADAIESLMADSDLRLRLTKQGRCFIVENLDWSIISIKYNSILEQIARNKNGN